MGIFDGLRYRARRRRGVLMCQQAVELMTNYLEGALSTVERARFELHLRACHACAAYLEQLRVTITTLGRTAVTEPTDPVLREQLIELYRRTRGDRS